MKSSKKWLSVAALFLLLYSCTKDKLPTVIDKPTSDDTLTLIVAKWKIISDSVTSVSYTTPSGWIPIPGVYYGVPEDFYLFDSSYHVNAHENGHDYLNGTYKLLPDSHFLIDTTDKNYIGVIKVLNKVNATFEWERFSSNGGRYFRRLSLIK